MYRDTSMVMCLDRDANRYSLDLIITFFGLKLRYYAYHSQITILTFFHESFKCIKYHEEQIVNALIMWSILQGAIASTQGQI